MTDDDFVPPSSTHLSLSPGTAAGLAGLFIGCTLLISACVLMVFNILLFSHGFLDIPRDLAKLGGVIGAAGVTVLGVLGLAFGVRGWSAAQRSGESTILGAAGTVAAGFGLIAWLIAGIDLVFILFG